MYDLYTDDSILAGTNQEEIGQIVKYLNRSKLVLTIEGYMQDFLGVKIWKQDDGTIILTQPHMIYQIVTNMQLPDKKVKS